MTAKHNASRGFDARSRLSSLNGLRALCNVSVMFFHWALYVVWTRSHNFGGEDQYKMLQKPWHAALVQIGFVGGDALLTLSALLSAYTLIPALQKAPSMFAQIVTILRYYLKRLARVLPAFLVALRLSVLVTSRLPPGLDLDPFSGKMWKNLAHKAAFLVTLNPTCPNSWPLELMMITNYTFPFHCMQHTWTLHAQIGFWLFFPVVLLVLKPRADGIAFRLKVSMWVTIAGVMANRLLLLFRKSYFPFPLFALPWDETSGAANVAYIGQLYTPTHTRLASFASGVLVALAVLQKEGTVELQKDGTVELQKEGNVEPQKEGNVELQKEGTVEPHMATNATPIQSPSGDDQTGNSNKELKTGNSSATPHPPASFLWSVALPLTAASMMVYSLAYVTPFGRAPDPTAYPLLRSVLTDFTACWGPITSMCTAYLLYCLLCSSDMFFSAISNILSSVVWRWPARLSYSAYLIHMIVQAAFLCYVLPADVQWSYSKPAELLYYSGFYFLLVYCTAAVLHFVVEQPALWPVQRLLRAASGTTEKVPLKAKAQ